MLGSTRERCWRPSSRRGCSCGDRACDLLALSDLEGELFFGAAPELDRYFETLKASVAAGARVLILRWRRVRNPDLVCMERLEHFLRELEREGVVVLLSGVGRDLERAMKNLRFEAWLPSERVFRVVENAPGRGSAAEERHGLASGYSPRAAD